MQDIHPLLSEVGNTVTDSNRSKYLMQVYR